MPQHTRLTFIVDDKIVYTTGYLPARPQFIAILRTRHSMSIDRTYLIVSHDVTHSYPEWTTHDKVYRLTPDTSYHTLYKKIRRLIRDWDKRATSHCKEYE